MKKFLTIMLATVLIIVGSMALFACDKGNDTATTNPIEKTNETDSKIEDNAVDTTNNSGVTKYYTVTFVTNSDIVLPETQVESGAKVDKPLLQTKHDSLYDYELTGWVVGEKEWNFSADTVTNNITLVARWEKIGTSKQFLPQ